LNHLTSSKHTPDANEDSFNAPEREPVDIEKLLDQKLTQREKQRQEENNYNDTISKFKEKYGENYVQSLKRDIEALGLTPDYVNELARKAPKALFKTLGLDQPRQGDVFQAPPSSDKRTTNFAPTGSEKRGFSYYQNLKKTQPLVYLDHKVQNQMHKDAQLMGEDFLNS
jgi:hypothetical protein